MAKTWLQWWNRYIFSSFNERTFSWENKNSTLVSIQKWCQKQLEKNFHFGENVWILCSEDFLRFYLTEENQSIITQPFRMTNHFSQDFSEVCHEFEYSILFFLVVGVVGASFLTYGIILVTKRRKIYGFDILYCLLFFCATIR